MKKAKKGLKKVAAPAGPAALETKGVCFVIMPFGSWFDQYYTHIYCPAIRDAGLEPKRADDLYRPGSIIQDIWQFTKSSALMLADLSGKNPNVFYELGLAHAIGKPVILVTDNIDDVPFDLRPLRVLEYEKNRHDWGALLRAGITKAIGEVLADPKASILAAFLEIGRSQRASDVSSRDKESLSLKQDIEALRLEMRRMRGSRYGSALLSSRQNFEGPTEATEYITLLKSRGISAAAAIEMVNSRGAPPDWTRATVQEIYAGEEPVGQLVMPMTSDEIKQKE